MSVSGSGSPARKARAATQSRGSHSRFLKTSCTSPNAFVVVGNCPCATGRDCGLSVAHVRGNTTPHDSKGFLAKHGGIPRAAAEHVVVARGAGAGADRRTAVVGVRAEIPRDTRRQRVGHRPVRRAANPARRALRLPRRLADRSLGPTPFAAVVQRAVGGRLLFGPAVATLAGLGAGRVSV